MDTQGRAGGGKEQHGGRKLRQGDGAGPHRKNRTGPLTGPQGKKQGSEEQVVARKKGYTETLQEGRARSSDHKEGEWQVVSGTAASSS
eukprot:4706470-Heterocapsa_arctica.AAC.1